jgi:hypothetical protein
MTTTRMTIAGIEGMPRPLEGSDVRQGIRLGARDAALAAVALAILVLLAF